MDEFVPDAPLKKKRDKEYCRSVNSTAKRRIFLNATEEKFKTFILERLDDFIKNLKSSLDIFCIFVDLVSKNDFPLDNIAWQLFLDVVRFYNADNVTGLRFDDENSSNMLFWIYGQCKFLPCHKAGKLSMHEPLPIYPKQRVRIHHLKHNAPPLQHNAPPLKHNAPPPAFASTTVGA